MRVEGRLRKTMRRGRLHVVRNGGTIVGAVEKHGRPKEQEQIIRIGRDVGVSDG